MVLVGYVKGRSWVLKFCMSVCLIVMLLRESRTLYVDSTIQLMVTSYYHQK